MSERLISSTCLFLLLELCNMHNSIATPLPVVRSDARIADGPIREFDKSILEILPGSSLRGSGKRSTFWLRLHCPHQSGRAADFSAQVMIDDVKLGSISDNEIRRFLVPRSLSLLKVQFGSGISQQLQLKPRKTFELMVSVSEAGIHLENEEERMSNRPLLCTKGSSAATDPRLARIRIHWHFNRRWPGTFGIGCNFVGIDRTNGTDLFAVIPGSQEFSGVYTGPIILNLKPNETLNLVVGHDRKMPHNHKGDFIKIESVDHEP